MVFPVSVPANVSCPINPLGYGPLVSEANTLLPDAVKVHVEGTVISWLTGGKNSKVPVHVVPFKDKVSAKALVLDRKRKHREDKKRNPRARQLRRETIIKISRVSRLGSPHVSIILIHSKNVSQ